MSFISLMPNIEVMRNKRVKLAKQLAWATSYAAVLLSLVAGFIIWHDRHVTAQAQGRIFTDTRVVPRRPVALLLGTSKYAHRRVNLFYLHRIEAAAELFFSGAVRAILVSGDNAQRAYNEPKMIKRDLVRLGVPVEFITLDYAGFRTLDSVVRAKAVFGQATLIVVSQRFHCERAIYLGDALGVNLIGFAVQDVKGPGATKVRLREVFARAKAFLDVHILNAQPKFLGKPIAVRLNESGQALWLTTDPDKSLSL
ncbi:MAG: YdcF family protein [bacterium]|nr:YdcF family protein [bacterium]